MTVRLDAARIAELVSLFPDGDLQEFLDGALRELGGQIDSAEASLRNDDFAAVAYAAHTGRNHALMCGATELGLALEVLQAAANSSRSEWAETALRQVRAAWPVTREAIAQVGARSQE